MILGYFGTFEAPMARARFLVRERTRSWQVLIICYGLSQEGPCEVTRRCIVGCIQSTHDFVNNRDGATLEVLLVPSIFSKGLHLRLKKRIRVIGNLRFMRKEPILVRVVEAEEEAGE